MATDGRTVGGWRGPPFTSIATSEADRAVMHLHEVALGVSRGWKFRPLNDLSVIFPHCHFSGLPAAPSPSQGEEGLLTMVRCANRALRLSSLSVSTCATKLTVQRFVLGNLLTHAAKVVPHLSHEQPNAVRTALLRTTGAVYIKCEQKPIPLRAASILGPFYLR